MNTHLPAQAARERYAVQREIGRGSMGVVYVAQDRLSGQTVALKRVTTAHESFDGAADETTFNLALAHEFRTLASLRHPHIISVLDYGFDDTPQPYFTMEYLEGARTVLDSAAVLPVAVRVQRLVQVLQALAYLHRRHIIHRDLKPENVLLDADGQVKLLDFGLASQFDQEHGLIGSLRYMAPEMLTGEATGEATDLYAVGVLAYEMFAGQHPFPGHDTNSLIRAIINEPPDLTPLFDATGNRALTNVVARLLAKDPADRYREANRVILDLCDATGQPAPAETSAIRESYLQAAQFVGRERELNILTSALALAAVGEGSAWLVAGESGIGKSRLLDELRIQALVKGVTVLSGQAVEGGGLPYQLWRDVIRPLVLTTDVTPAESGILQIVVPDIEALTGVEPLEPAALEAEADQRRLVLTIGELFRRADRPLLLLVEDLHWAQESLAPLKHLSLIARDLPLMVVGAYRSDESAYLYGQLSEMALLKLERLSDEALATLSQSMLGAAGRESHVLELLQQQTEGNALFAVEIVRSLADEAGSLDRIGRTQLPETIAARGIIEVVQRRLQRLPPSVLPLLRLAAVAGRELDTALLALAQNTDDLDLWLWHCAEASVFEVVQGRWRFTHDRIRESVLAGIDAAEQAALHRTVAAALEALHVNDVNYAIPLYEHWRLAGEREKAGQYAERAAEQALRVNDFPSAIRFLEDALATPGQPDVRAGLLVQLARLHIHRTDYALAEPLLQEALDLAVKTGDLAIQSDVDAERGRMGHLRSDYDQAITYGESAALLARRAGDLVREVNALGVIGAGYTRKGELDKAEPLFERGLALAQQAGDQSLVVKMLRNKTVVPYFQRRFDEVYATLQDILRLGRELMDHEIILTSLGNLSLLAWQLGKLDEAVKYAEDNLAISTITGERWSVAQIRNLLGFVYLDRGEDEPARRNLVAALIESKAVQAPSVTLDTLAGFARLLAAEGQTIRAFELLGLALSHPASSNEVRLTVEPILESLRATSSPEAVESALARGALLDLDAVAAELIQS